jgi:hypothetical protein
MNRITPKLQTYIHVFEYEKVTWIGGLGVRQAKVEGS